MPFIIICQGSGKECDLYSGTLQKYPAVNLNKTFWEVSLQSEQNEQIQAS